MPSIIYKESEETRVIIYDPVEEPIDKPFTYVHLMPIEIQRIKEGTPEQVQSILRRYI